MNRALLFGVLAIVLAGLALGLAVVGGPGHARMEARDQMRLTDLHWFGDFKACQLKPASQERDCAGLRGADNPTDPQTGAAFTFTQDSEDAFRVCAVFETDPKDLSGYQTNGLSVEGQTGCLAYQRSAVNGDWLQR